MKKELTKSERDKLATAKLNAILKENQNGQVLFTQFASSLNKVVEMAVNTGKDKRDSVMQSQLLYKKRLIDAIDSIPLEKALELLNNAKSTHERSIIDDKIRNVDFSVAASNIKDIIDPLIDGVKRKLEAEILIQKSKSKIIETTNAQPITIKEQDKVQAPLLQIAAVSSADFEQIECDATKEEIETFFSVLAETKNKRNDKPFMSKEDVDQLLKMNFKIFGENPVQRIYNINLFSDQKKMLAYFVFQFYDKYELNPNGNKMKYVHFLIRNFERFKNDDPKNLTKNMCRSKKPTRDAIVSTRD